MPFRSEAERTFLKKNHPDIYERWEKARAQLPDATLPERAPLRAVGPSRPAKPSRVAEVAARLVNRTA